MKKSEILSCISVPIKFGIDDIHVDPWITLEGDGSTLTALHSTSGVKAQSSVESDSVVSKIRVNGIMFNKALGAMAEDIELTVKGNSLLMKSSKGSISMPTYPQFSDDRFNYPDSSPDFIMEQEELTESIKYAKGRGTLWMRDEHIASVSPFGGSVLMHPASEMSVPERFFPGFTGIKGDVSVWNFDEAVVFNWGDTWIGYKKYRSQQDMEIDRRLLSFEFDKIGEASIPDFSPFRKLGISRILWDSKGITSADASEVELNVTYDGYMDKKIKISIPSFPRHYTSDKVDVFYNDRGVKFVTGDWVIFSSMYK